MSVVRILSRVRRLVHVLCCWIRAMNRYDPSWNTNSWPLLFQKADIHWQIITLDFKPIVLPEAALNGLCTARNSPRYLLRNLKFTRTGLIVGLDGEQSERKFVQDIGFKFKEVNAYHCMIFLQLKWNDPVWHHSIRQLIRRIPISAPKFTCRLNTNTP